MTFFHNLSRLAPLFAAKAIVLSGLLLALLMGCASPAGNETAEVGTATAVPPTATLRLEETAVVPSPTVPSAPTDTKSPHMSDDALPTPTALGSTPTPTSPESRALFLPQCDKRPLTDLPTRPHPETGETWVRYANEAYGFAFVFPPTWELVEGQSYLCLNYLPQPEITFVVGFKWLDDRQTAITRSGVASGELTTDGTIQFLGREVERNVLRHEGQDKAILYDNAAPIRVNDLLFTLSLDDFSTPYEAAELAPEISQLADAIVASFELIDRLYVNHTYGFSFVVPPEWRLRPAQLFDSPPDWQNALQLTYRPDRTNSAILTIAFKWEEEEDLRIVRTGTGPLDEIIEGEIEFMGQAIGRDVWRFEGKTQAVFYANAYHINVNGLLFTLSLDYFDNRQLGGELSADAMASADAIVESFRLTWEDEWQTIHSDALGFAIDMPADWRSHLDEGAAYFFSDKKFGAGPTPLTYYVYALEYPNPEQRPFADVVTSDLNLGVQENFTYSTEVIGDKTVYITEQMPSMDGALTVFFELNGRYLSLALTPYDSQTPYFAQARYVALFEMMLQSLEPLPLTYHSDTFGFQFTVPDSYIIYEYDHPEAALVLSLYEKSRVAAEQIHKPELFVTVQQNQDNLSVEEWFLAHTSHTLTDDYPIYVNPRNPRTYLVTGRNAIQFEDMTWGHALVTLVEGDGYILVIGYTPFADEITAEAFERLLTSLIMAP